MQTAHHGERPGHAVVIGASLAGLMSALALSRAGLVVTVLERAAAFTRTGAAVAIDAGRLAGLARLGVTMTVPRTDRKSTRLNSSHANISYAVFCLKKKKT